MWNCNFYIKIYIVISPLEGNTKSKKNRFIVKFIRREERVFFESLFRTFFRFPRASNNIQWRSLFPKKIVS